MFAVKSKSLVLLALSLSAACGSAEDPVGVEVIVRDAGGQPDAASNDAGGTPFDSSITAIPPFDAQSPGPALDPDGGCASSLTVVVRDFTEMHPDFEAYTAEVKGLVEERLGADKKPVYAHPAGTVASTSPEAFHQWYRDVAGVNMQVPVSIAFQESTPGVFVYDSSAFFPIDGQGFGNGPATGINIPIFGMIGGGTPPHNFLFTTEAHTRFTYKGRETFTFRGDDDLWVFINDHLAVDLGGTHQARMQSINLDALAQQLGITVGQTYGMDIFHAERHTSESNYRIETTIDLSCIENVPIR